MDEAQRIVYGLVTAEQEDQEGEILDYATTVPYYKALNERFKKATDGKSICPLREMHQLSAVGVGKEIDFLDEQKEIKMAFKVVDDTAWLKVSEGVYTGFSQGGRYVKVWKAQDGKKHYTADPTEVSLVDNPALPTATFEYVKADGAVETKSFLAGEPPAGISDADVHRIASEVTSRIEKAKKKITSVVGKLKGQTSTTVQTIIFSPKDEWMVSECKAWLKDHDFKCSKAEESDDAFRFKQKDPSAFDENSFRTVPFRGGGKVMKLAKRKSEFLMEIIEAETDLTTVQVVDRLRKAFEVFQYDAPLMKSLYEAHTIMECFQTLAYCQRSLENEREYEGDESPVPDTLAGLLPQLQALLLELVSEETDEILAAISGSEGVKAMNDEMKKAVAAEVTKALEVLKAKSLAHMHKLKKMLSDHHDATVDMHKAHHTEMHGAANMTAAKTLATSHMAKAISHHTDHLGKALAHCDKTVESMTEGDTAVAGNVTEIEPKTGEGWTGGHSTGKAEKTVETEKAGSPVTLEAITELFDKKLEENTTNVLKAIFGAIDEEGKGVGDRTQTDQSALKIHQTEKITDAGGAKGVSKTAEASKTEVVPDAELTKEDAEKAFRSGDSAAMLKIARSIKADPNGVPVTLQGAIK